MIKLHTQEGRDNFNCYNQQSIEDFLKGKPVAAMYEKTKVFGCDGETVAILPNNKVFAIRYQGGDWLLVILDDIKKLNDSLDFPGAVLIDIPKRNKQNASFKQLLLLNGDNSADIDGYLEPLVDHFSADLFPVTSFACLARFYKEGEALRRLCRGDLKVVDYTTSEFRKSKNKKTPPAPGFTWTHGGWHRSGTVLFHDKERKVCILTGQDEGTYFGVELPKLVRTVQEAFQALVPKEVKGSFQRQGEWFMVEVNDKDVPKLSECLVLSEASIALPIESDDSNRHSCLSDDIRIAKDGRIYALNPDLSHGEHTSIACSGWATFYKNTAIRSFSQEGVD